MNIFDDRMLWLAIAAAVVHFGALSGVMAASAATIGGLLAADWLCQRIHQRKGGAERDANGTHGIEGECC